VKVLLRLIFTINNILQKINTGGRKYVNNIEQGLNFVGWEQRMKKRMLKPWKSLRMLKRRSQKSLNLSNL